jgi:hypothetical protein
MEVKLPDQVGSVGIEQDGEVYLVEGAREEMMAAMKAAGYRVSEEGQS